MNILLNNRSLVRQYSSPDDFTENGLKHILLLLKTANSLSEIAVLKNYDFYNSGISPEYTFRDILTIPKIARINDTIRRYKAFLLNCCESGFWEDTRVHDSGIFYDFDGEIVTDTCLAETCERDRLLFSFIPSSFDKREISIIKDRTTCININNFTSNDLFIDYLYGTGVIEFENYVVQKLAKSKLDFSKITDKSSNCLKDIPQEDQNDFLDSFFKFNELSWIGIGTHNGLRFKPYALNNSNRSNFVGYEGLSIFEFRASRKFRCFGYKEGAKFYLTYIDLEHRLGDI